jgi:hypothetical protein
MRTAFSKLLEEKINGNGIGGDTLKWCTVNIGSIIENVHHAFRKSDLRRKFEQRIIHIEPETKIKAKVSAFDFKFTGNIFKILFT